MKILYIVNEINSTTGLERILAVKTDYFIKNYGYDITILAVNGGIEKPFFEFNEKIKFFSLDRLKNSVKGSFYKLKKINKIIKNESPSIVISCIDDIYGLYIPFFLKKRCPFIYERHNSKNVNIVNNPKTFVGKLKNLLRKFLLNNGGRQYDKIVLLSDDHIEEWSGLNNIEIINNPLIFYPEEQAKLQNKKVLAVGRHCNQKGFDMLLKVWSIVVKKHKDWQLDIYGEKDKNESNIKLAKKYNILNTVNFHDPVENIMDVYIDSSIFALSSRFEGFPLVLIETMACGVPAVAFNCPHGVKKIIRHNEDGLIVSIGDIADFAKSIIYLIENPEKRIGMGHKAKINILRLSPENIFPKWSSLFENLVTN